MGRKRNRRNRRRTNRRSAYRGVRKRSGLNTSSLVFANRPSVMTVRGNTILPASLITRLPYSDLVQRSTTLTSPDIYSFRVNSIFDPDKTGAGYFPLGYSELNQIYQSYVCFGVSYDILAINMSDNVPARVCIIGTSTDQTWSTYQEANSQVNASKSCVLGTLDGGNSTARMKGYIGVAACFGVPKKTVSLDDLYRAAFGSSPANQPVMQIVMGNLDGSATTDVHYEIHLKYFVRCYDLKPLTQSA